MTLTSPKVVDKACLSDQLHSVLGELLQAKGVPADQVTERMQGAVHNFCLRRDISGRH